MAGPLVLMSNKYQRPGDKGKECALIALFRKCKCASSLLTAEESRAPASKLKENME